MWPKQTPKPKLSNLEFGNPFWRLCVFSRKTGVWATKKRSFYEGKVLWIKSWSNWWVYTVRKGQRSFYSIFRLFLSVIWPKQLTPNNPSWPILIACLRPYPTSRSRPWVTFFGEYTSLMRSFLVNFPLWNYDFDPFWSVSVRSRYLVSIHSLWVFTREIESKITLTLPKSICFY